MPTGRMRGNPVIRWSLAVKKRIAAVLYEKLSPVTAGILAAMLWGDKDTVPAVVYDSMVRVGTIHILVVSGYNVGIVAGLIMGIMKFFRIPPEFRYWSAPVFLVLYCLMTGFSPPVVRATIMACVFLCARAWQRDADALTVCSFAALVILACRPRQIFDVSFQLSFGAVVSIVVIYPWLRGITMVAECKYSLVRWLADNVFVSISAWVGTAGFIFYYFKTFSFVSVFANIFIPALAGLITLTGLSFVLLGDISGVFAAALMPINEYLVAVLIKLNAFFYGFVA
jgi:competence protein ComEC